MGGSSGGGDQVTTIRYADYVEAHHQTFLNIMASKRDAVIDSSPYATYTDIEIDPGFFGTGYILASFPSLYDMYGKFMAGLDIEVLFDQTLVDTLDSAYINNLISVEGVRMTDDIIEVAQPRFVTGMRDINSVISGSFVTGKAMLEDARVKALSRFSAELKYRLIPAAVERWRSHLDWNKTVVMTYAEILKLYISSKMDTENLNFEMAAKNLLWPFTVLEYNRAALGALQGATTATSDVAGASKTQKAIGGALSGAVAGATLFPANPIIGAIVGGVLGAGAGLLGG